jgi:excisionase family DNA binding protein
MPSTMTLPDVLTTEEVAEFLRLSEDTVRHYAARLMIPGRQIGDQWRFSRRALEDWLRGPSGKQAILAQAGAFEDDKEDLEQLRASIYRDRGRPEVDEGP